MHDMVAFRLLALRFYVVPAPVNPAVRFDIKIFFQGIKEGVLRIRAKIREQPAVPVDLHLVVGKHDPHEPEGLGIAGDFCCNPAVSNIHCRLCPVVPVSDIERGKVCEVLFEPGEDLRDP